MVTAYSAPGKLSRVDSVQALVGDAPELHVPVVTTRPSPGRTVVIGDSTAAGLGNRLVANPTAIDRACRRSQDSYAVALATVSRQTVTNLACGGATIRAGLLDTQYVGGELVPPQLSDPAVAKASTIIVSIGANDVRWSDLLLVCAISRSCQNNAEEAAFQQYLAAFSTDYLQLLSELQALPAHPRVLINLYYDPFGDKVDCLTHLGVTPKKREAMGAKLAALNRILSSGAEAASFAVAEPNFAGHGLCSPAPFVQGIDDKAPFHPTPGGEFAIALADEHALRSVDTPSQ
jgi:lysophospholipase L1-like esterase